MLLYIILFVYGIETAIISKFQSDAATENFPYVNDLSNNFKLYWKFNSTHITFETHVKTRGYIGFGITSFPYKAENPHDLGDLVVGWVDDASEKVYFKDMISRDYGIPQVDAQQDWTLLYSQQTEDKTVLKFVRKLDTCDKDDIVVKAGNTRVMWAYSDSDPISKTTIAYHGNGKRGYQSLSLLKPPTPMYNAENFKDPESFTIDILNKQYKVRNVETTYKCTAFKNPIPNNEKHHVIKFEPVIQKENIDVVHHIFIYYCDDPVDVDKWDGHEYVCGDEMLRNRFSCNSIWLGWSVGGLSYSLPDHVGFPIGGDGPNFFILETHYNNPELRSDIVDSSGLRLTFTSTLRLYDAGVFKFGSVTLENHMMIPPRSLGFLISGYCPSNCLNHVFKDQKEIHVFAGTLHMHMFGVEIRTKIVRDGAEIGLVDADYNYDFLIQHWTNLGKEITLRKGDSLITECLYITKNRTTVTIGGIGTKREMCLSHPIYYPRQTSMTKCMSIPVYQNENSKIWERLDWTKQESHEKFQSITNTADHYVSCTVDNKASEKESGIHSNSALKPKSTLPPQQDCWEKAL